MKIAYQTNNQGFLIGEIQLQPNPRAKGEYLIPRNAVLEAPNIPKEGCVQVWDGKEWKYLEVLKKHATPPLELILIGVPIPYPKKDVPPGYLKMDGTRFRKTLYPKLAEVYEDGVIPDLRGMFIRGLGGHSGILLEKQEGSSLVIPRQQGGWPNAGWADDLAHLNNFDEYTVKDNLTYGSGYLQVVRDSPSVFLQYHKIRPDNKAFNYICWTGENYI